MRRIPLSLSSPRVSWGTVRTALQVFRADAVIAREATQSR
jgi:hypothetical protein